MRIFVARESDASEPRVAATPETVKKMQALGAEVAVEPGAGVKSGIDPRRGPEAAQAFRRAAETALRQIRLGGRGAEHGATGAPTPGSTDRSPGNHR